MECMCAQTRPRFIRKSAGGMESEPKLTPREKSLPEKIRPRGGSNPRRCVKQDSEPDALPTSYSGPPYSLSKSNPEKTLCQQRTKSLSVCNYIGEEDGVLARYGWDCNSG